MLLCRTNLTGSVFIGTPCTAEDTVVNDAVFCASAAAAAVAGGGWLPWRHVKK